MEINVAADAVPVHLSIRGQWEQIPWPISAAGQAKTLTKPMVAPGTSGQKAFPSRVVYGLGEALEGTNGQPPIVVEGPFTVFTWSSAAS